MKRQFSIILLISFIFLSNCSNLQHKNICIKESKSELQQLLEKFNGLQIKTLGADSIYSEKFELMPEQRLNHIYPDGGKFEQRVFLSHKGYNAPTILHTEGYSAGRNFCAELPKLMGTNEN